MAYKKINQEYTESEWYIPQPNDVIEGRLIKVFGFRTDSYGLRRAYEIELSGIDKKHIALAGCGVLDKHLPKLEGKPVKLVYHGKVGIYHKWDIYTIEV